MTGSGEGLGLEEAVRVLTERIGSDGTLALVSILQASLDARFERFEGRMDRRFTAVESRIDALGRQVYDRLDALATRMDERLDRISAHLDDRLDRVDARIDAVSIRIDGTLRSAILFCLSLLGLVAAVATGILALRW